MRMVAGVTVVVAAVSATPRAAHADDDTTQIHAFVSQGALLTTDNNFLADTKDGSLDFAEAGINFTRRLDDRLTAGIQLFARDLGGSDYNATFDWFDLDYRWRDWLGVRAGRVKLPVGLYNATSDIDAAQPVVLLPQSIYAIQNRTFLLAQTGVALYGYRPGGAAGALEYDAYLGTLSIPFQSTATTHVDKVRVPYVTGGRVLWSTPVDGLRVAGSLLAGQIDLDLTVIAPMLQPPSEIELRVVEGIGSVEFTDDHFQLVAEYGRARNHTSAGGMTSRVTAESMYALAGYRWRPWLQTTGYYSLAFPNVAERSGRENHQHDAALCARFDITPHWLVKLEAHYLRGTAELSSAQNGGMPLDMLVNQWLLFAAKATAYF